MSDSDEDLVPNSFHKFPHEKAGYRPQSTNLSKTSYSMMTSKFNTQNHFPSFDQRSTYSNRETSPMSLRSLPNSRMQHQQQFSQSAMSSQPISSYNARCRSPMSVRSIDSNASVSAADIAFTLKNSKFNKYDLQMIRDAYKAHLNKHKRRRLGKRRDLKSFIKHCRRKSGGESGAEGSNSSISSDDCRSTRSAFCTRNIQATSRPSKRNFVQVSENDLYKDYTDTYQQNSYRDVQSGHQRIVNHTSVPYGNQNTIHVNRQNELPQAGIDQYREPQNAPNVTLKDRLAKDSSMLLPFQRFNRSVVNPTYEISYKVKSQTVQQKEPVNNKGHDDTANDSDEIFSQSTSKVNLESSTNHKNILETENFGYPESKRKKLSTSPINHNKRPPANNMKKVITKRNEFNFKKPLLPVRRFNTAIRSSEPEILISKSSHPPFSDTVPTFNQLKKTPQAVIYQEEKKDSDNQSKPPIEDPSTNITATDSMHNSTEVSMKPSFIKRKLFTQKLDIVENKNISSDNINSPQTNGLRVCREKNKVRKLTSQSCLSRDITGDNNYLDLIHKIVPPEQIKNQTLNSTNMGNKKEADQISLNTEDRWDVSKAASMCIDNGSDTYTDEEIFNITQEKGARNKKVNKKTTDNSPKPANAQQTKQSVVTKCKVLVQKLPENCLTVQSNNQLKQKDYSKTVMSCIKSFWDTDFESDIEDRTSSTLKTSQIHQVSRDSKFLMKDSNKNGPNKKLRGTIMSVRNSENLAANSRTKYDDGQSTRKDKANMLDEVQTNKENNNNNILNRSHLRNNGAKVLQNVKNKILQNNSDKDLSKSKNQQKEKQEKPKKTSSAKKNKQTQSIFNISRESLRKRRTTTEKRANNSFALNANSITPSSNKCNRSRESLRIKQRIEASANTKYGTEKKRYI